MADQHGDQVTGATASSEAAPVDAQARALAQLTGVFHNLSYYAPELRGFRDAGIEGYWRAYLAYRSAPLGPVPASVVTAIFYNFAPRVVATAIPSVWEHLTPVEALVLRDELMDRALVRAFGDQVDSPAMAEAAALARSAIEHADVVGRPLFAAHRSLPWPDAPHQQLFRAATLWREHRGDGHNIALAAARIDGIECHALLAGKGVVTGRAIEKLRGWTPDEWDAAVSRLAARGVLEPDGSWTPAGRALHAQLERDTDTLSAEPRNTLGPDSCQQLIDLMSPLVTHLVETGAVEGSWPPKRVHPERRR